MSWLGRMFKGDEELGKKNDDHRPQPNNASSSSSSWSTIKASPALRKRRIIYAVVAFLFIYLFVKNIPDDLGPVPQHLNPRVNVGAKLPQGAADPPAKKPKHPATPSEAEEHYHDGPIKFYKLASSLYSVARLGGQSPSNKNVLFAASSLKSASEIIPLACEMARWERNDVHFAIMGRDDMEMQELKSLNGAVDECNVHWHDARPDYSRWSSEFRMEISVEASMEHIQTFIHPQVIIIDNSGREDTFFVRTLRSKAMDIGRSIIELPSSAAENMMWITRLDSGSLAAWSTIYIDLLIQAPSGSSGSLVRLLKSIESADYLGTRRPHLTIELPAEIDAATGKYLEKFVWPPVDSSGAAHASQVTLRHRIPRRTLTEYETSARLIESFYPATTDSHVLLLSSQIELSPLYYHYLIYHLLEYKYSSYGKEIKTSPHLMGISLELPTYFLDDTKRLTPPVMEKSPSNPKGGKVGEPTPFLWQAPNSNAALYFGDKWIEFHSFLTARLSKPPTTRTKTISNKHPFWLEFLLELMRTRRYSLLYPNFSVDDETIATVHNELYQLPEEFPREPSAPVSVPELNPDEPLSLVYERKERPPPNTEHSLSSSTLLSILPNSGDLPEITNLPLLSFSGTVLTQQQANDDAWGFTQEYRREIGGCKSEAEVTKREPNSALDLFCHLDQVYDPRNTEAFNSGNTVHRVNPQTRPPVDDDVISAEQKENVKKEASGHLARQAGKGTASPPPKDKSDSGKEAQTEFQAQMERQKKQSWSYQDKVAKEKQDPKKPVEDLKKPVEDPKKPVEDPKTPAEDPGSKPAPEKGPGW